MLVVAVAAMVGCKKSVKGEESRWTSANKAADKAATLYPAFKQAVEERRKQAKAIYDEAQKIEDEKAKISKLSSANQMLTTGFVAQLAAIDEQVKEIRSQMIEAAGNVEGVDKARADEAIRQAKSIMRRVDGTLRKGATDVKSAEVVVNKVVADLTEAKGHLAGVAPKKPDPEPAKTTPSADTTTPKADPAKENWTCDYCDHSNKHDATKCANCGADKTVKK